MIYNLRNKVKNDYRLNDIVKNIEKRIISKLNRENNTDEERDYIGNKEILAEISSNIIIDYILSNRADIYGYADYIIENQYMKDIEEEFKEMESKYISEFEDE